MEKINSAGEIVKYLGILGTRNYVSLILIFTTLLVSVQAQTVSLQLQSDYTTGGTTYSPSLAVGDVNNDGRPDLVTTNRDNPAFVAVYLNNGAGGFAAPIQAGSIPSARVVVLGDFNEDGNLDMVIGTDSLSAGLNIRLGNGTGAFPTGTDTGSATIESVSDLATADFNGDGNLDLVMTKVGGYNTTPSNAVKVWLGNGSGGFSGFITSALMFGGAQDIEVADFNTDGRPDIAATAPNSNVVQVLLNDGAGGFNAPINTTSNGAQKLVTADFNRDCIPDLAVTRGSTGNAVSILLGNGAGGFGAPNVIAITNQTDGVAVGDFNRDKKTDVAVRRISATAGVPNFTILPGNGLGGFGSAVELTLPISSSSATSLAVMDANADGRTDIVINRNGGFALYNGSSSLFTRTENDFDGDLSTDFSVYRPSDNTWYLQASTAGYQYIPWGVPTDVLTPGDFDGDGKTDTAIWRPSTGTWWIFYSSNRNIVSAQWGVAGDIPQSGDFDGDGKSDYVLWRPSTGIWYLRQSGVGGFATRTWGVAGDIPVAGDYDGDGRDDVAVWRPSNGNWYRINSTNSQMVTQSWGVATDLPVNGDYDADGKEDVAIFRPSSGTWHHINSSNNNLVASAWGQSGDIPVPGDYNGDGVNDRAVYRAGTWHINQCIQGQEVRQFGLATDKAIPASDLP